VARNIHAATSDQRLLFDLGIQDYPQADFCLLFFPRPARAGRRQITFPSPRESEEKDLGVEF
jgi:hypothetical protein